VKPECTEAANIKVAMTPERIALGRYNITPDVETRPAGYVPEPDRRERLV
jgi:hypothetical protein